MQIINKLNLVYLCYSKVLNNFFYVYAYSFVEMIIIQKIYCMIKK